MTENDTLDPNLKDAAPAQPYETNVAPHTADQVTTGFDPDQYLASKQANMGPQEKADYEEQQDQEVQGKYGTLPQEALAGVESLGKGLLGPASTALETKVFGVKGQDIRGREEANPWIHGIFETAGLAGPAIVSGGESLAARATLGGGLSAAAKALVPEVAGQAGLAKVGSTAARMAIEGGLYGASDEASKMLTGDPNQSAQTAITNIGINAAFGGALGGAAAIAHPLWQSTVGDKLGSYLEAFNRRANGESILDPELESATTTLKSQLSPEIRGTLSDIPELQNVGAKLNETLTQPGVDFRKSMEDVNSQLEESALSTIGKTPEDVAKASDYSRAKQSELVSDSLIKEIKDQYNPIKEKFEGVQDNLKNSLLPDDVKANAADGISKYLIDEHIAEHPDSPEMKFGNNAIKMLQESKTGAGLKKAVESLGAQANKEGLWHLWGEVQDHLFDAIDSATQASIKDPTVLKNYLAARQAYKGLSQDLQPVAKQLNLGKYKGPGGLLYKIENTVGKERFLDKLTPEDNAEFLQHLDKFPKTKELVQEHQSNQLLKDSMYKGEFKLNKFVTNASKMNPEYRDFSFKPGSDKTLKAIGTLKNALDSIPRNNSHTAGFLSSAMSKMPSSTLGIISGLLGHNPIMGFGLGKLGEWLGRDMPDAVRLGLLKTLGSEAPVNSAAFKSSVEFIHNLIKGEGAVSNATSAIFESGAKVLPDKLWPDEKKIKLLDEKVKELQVTPEDVMDSASEIAHYMPEQGTAISQTATQALNYLSMIRPNVPKTSPLDKDLPPNKDAEMRYKNALMLAEQPLVLMHNLKEGIITNEDIQAVKAIYPALYQRLQTKVYSNLVDHVSKDNEVPYKLKVGLSLFLNQAMDSTLMPQAIMSNQAALNGEQLSNQSAPKQRQKRSSLGGLKELKLSNRFETGTQELEEPQA